MSAGRNAPVIIKRKKVVGGDGHHGGAWKVAYADFVTAMMAFFMLMWLLNATTEQQRKGIADYFSPTIPINRVSGGGSGAFGGDNIFSEDALAQSGTGINQPTIGDQPMRSTTALGGEEAEQAAQIAALQQVEDILFGRGGESAVSELALRHIITRLTDEGLIIEIFDLPQAQLFLADSTTPNPIAQDIAAMLSRVFQRVTNPVAIKGHLAAKPILAVDNPVWDRSVGRAMAMRSLLEDAEFDPRRIVRITGAGDRESAVRDATALRNNRIEIILLRTDR